MIYYRRRQICTFCQDGSVSLRLPQNHEIIRLSGTARRIWEILEHPVSLTEIVNSLAAEFAADREEIAEETKPFLESLNEKGLLDLSPKMPSSTDRQRYRYLFLLKRALMNLIYPEHELRMRFLQEQKIDGRTSLERTRYLRDIRYQEPESYQALIDAKYGIGFSAKAPYRFSHTMIGMAALDNLERCAEIVFSEKIPGDFMEAGVCQGGAAIFLRALQVAYDAENRRLWAADSFEGLPPPESEPDIASGVNWSEANAPFAAFGLEGVRDNFIRYGLLDEEVHFLPGWFDDTLPSAPIGQLAILRLDADLYASTQTALAHLYPRVTPGGFVILDDYGAFKYCRQAVDEYRTQHGIDESLHFVNRHCVYWRKRT